MMRKFCILVLAVALAIMHSCADYQEEPAPASFSVGSTELSFYSNAGIQSTIVSSGKKWDISSMPAWVSVLSITTDGLYQWTVSFCVSENNDYYREGTILFKSSTETAEVIVKQAGKMDDIDAGAEVDLGLSVKWATCNVGASSPEEFGNYYAWGETSTKSDYSWSTYNWCNGTSSSLTKYNTKTDNGTVDNKTQLELADDAARANWGGKWRMPTDAEWTELRNNCTWTWTTQNGVYGRKVTSNINGNSIFLPAAGLRGGSTLSYAGSYGFYWSSTLYTDSPDYAFNVYFHLSYVGMSNGSRSRGQSVRPVTE